MKRLAASLYQWARLPALRETLLLFLGLRVFLIVWMALVLVLLKPDLRPSNARPYLGQEPVTGGIAELLLGPWQRFDTLHFTALAREGYQPYTVFLPLYPLSIRALGGLLGSSTEAYLTAALLVSNAACLGYLLLFRLWARTEVDDATARRAQIYVALSPWAFMLVAAYAESLLLFLAVAALLADRRRYGWLAGLCGALASLTRLSGALLALPLLAGALARRGDGKLWPPRRAWFWPLGLDLFWATLPVLTVIGFQIWRVANGMPSTIDMYSSVMHHRPVWPWEGVVNALRLFFAGAAHPTDYLDFTFAFLFLFLVASGWRRLSPATVLYLAFVFLLNISHTRVPHPMSSVGRHTLEMFPAFLILAQIGKRSSWLNRVVVYPSIVLLLYLSGQFAIWGWVG